MGFVKASLLFYYKRIFVSRFFIIASNTLLSLIACFTTSIFLVSCKAFDSLAAAHAIPGSIVLEMADPRAMEPNGSI